MSQLVFRKYIRTLLISQTLALSSSFHTGLGRSASSLSFIHHYSGRIIIPSSSSSSSLAFATMPRGVKKENLPSKTCVVCNRPFTVSPHTHKHTHKHTHLNFLVLITFCLSTDFAFFFNLIVAQKMGTMLGRGYNLQ